MDRAQIRELHYITPLANLSSIMQRGILSHRRAEKLSHESIADPGVQDQRAGKHVPSGGLLHEYVNLYFDARNPMMYKRKHLKAQIVVLRVSSAVLDIPGTVITDGNAASNATAFYPSPAGLSGLEAHRVYAQSWTDADVWAYYEKKRQRCAEVLVPHAVPTNFLIGCYVCSDEAASTCRAHVSDLEVEVYTHVYFS